MNYKWASKTCNMIFEICMTGNGILMKKVGWEWEWDVPMLTYLYDNISWYNLTLLPTTRFLTPSITNCDPVFMIRENMALEYKVHLHYLVQGCQLSRIIRESPDFGPCFLSSRLETKISSIISRFFRWMYIFYQYILSTRITFTIINCNNKGKIKL